MRRRHPTACACWAALVWLMTLRGVAGPPDVDALRVGVAGHAFDHLGNLGDQADAVVASGGNVIYGTGFGWAYEGLRPTAEMERCRQQTVAYLTHARAAGVRLAFGYVCATSIVRLATFDQNWPAELRAAFATKPADWVQRDRDGKPLASWYGGDYAPACMNHPDWRAYEKHIVRLQLEAGFDGIFFDNPTVHPNGCYCDHCMRKFADFAMAAGVGAGVGHDAPAETWRRVAVEQAATFRRFRATIASDFLREMRAYARQVKPGALVTCNNSLNAPDALFSQCRGYAYNIYGLSEVEDLVVVEDMATQPRTLADGRVVEYGSVYEVLRAVARGKPVVAVTIADGDYHTPARLMRLAMAEAAAHGASYLMWPTWPAEVRERMAAAVRPEAELLRANAAVLNDAKPRADVVLFLPYREWETRAECRAMELARAMGAANVQFEVVCEDDLIATLDGRREGAFVAESASTLNAAERAAVDRFQSRGGHIVWADGKDWLADVREAAPSLKVQGPATLRTVVRDQPGRTIVHVLNLNVRRVSSFEDQVVPAEGVSVEVRLPGGRAVRSVRAVTADDGATRGEVAFESRRDGDGVIVSVKLAKVEIGTILIVE